MKISLIASAGEKHYQMALLEALLDEGLSVEFIGNDRMSQSDIFRARRGVTLFNLRGNGDTNASLSTKALRTLKYYCRLLRYAGSTDSRLFHIQWLNSFILLDRTLMMLYYKLLGKKLIFTAHNVDGQARQGHSGFLNRLSLRCMYHIVDHTIVYTERMKGQLVEWFGVDDRKVSVIPHGVNNQTTDHGMSRSHARALLSIPSGRKVILFFGDIRPDKAPDMLLESFAALLKRDPSYMLVIAGRCLPQFSSYFDGLIDMICRGNMSDHVIVHPGFVPDHEVAAYFIAADCLVLPYRRAYQSGVIFLAYGFGLPVIATDVGSFSQDIISRETGYVCCNNNSAGLTEAIKRYFDSDLFCDIDLTRDKIKSYARDRYSWHKIADRTCRIYESLL